MSGPEKKQLAKAIRRRPTRVRTCHMCPWLPTAAAFAAAAAAAAVAAAERQGCSVVCSWGSLLWCCFELSVVCVLCFVFRRKKNGTGTYYSSSTCHTNNQKDDISEVRTYEIRPLVLKPGKSSYPLPPGKKNFERSPRASQSTDRAGT